MNSMRPDKVETETIASYSNKIMEWCLILLVFWGPLIISPISYDIYGLPKLVLTSIITLVITLAWITKWYKQGEASFLRTPLDVPILVFAVLVLLSTTTSIHPATSLFGSSERYQGLFSVLTYVLIYFSAVNIIRKPQQLARLGSALLVSGAIIAIYGIFQHFGIDFTAWSAGTDLTRIVSTIGNSNFLADYLVIVLPIAICFYLISTSRIHQLASLGAIILLFVALLFTYSRAGWTGFFFSAVFLFALARRELQLRKLRLLGLAMSLVFLALLANYSTTIDIGFKKTPSLLAQTKSSIEIGEGTVAQRLGLYKSALFVTRDRPLLGWGAQTFGVIFPKYKRYALPGIKPNGKSYDKAHNELLQISTGMGTIGILGFLWLVVTFLLTSFKLLPKIPDLRLKLILAGLVSGLIGYLIAIQFNFTIVGVAFLFWLGMAVITSAANTVSPEKTTRITLSRRGQIPLAALLTLVFLLLAVTSLQQLTADGYFSQGLKAANEGRLDASLPPLEKATAIWPNQALYTAVLTDVYLVKASGSRNLYWTDLALEKARQLTEQYPISPSGYIKVGNVYMKRYELSKRRSFLIQAISAYKRAVALDTLNAGTHYNLGLAYERIGSAKKAHRAYKKTLELDPNNSNAYKALKRVQSE